MKHGPDHPSPPVDLPPSAAGRWEMIAARFQNSATHAALLPTNKVFIYGGSSLDPDEFEHPTLPRAEILDLNTDPWQSYPVNCEPMTCDLWCSGHTFLADGRLLFAGGTSYYPPDPDPFYGGLREAWLFDPFGESWERLDDMQAGRWYPTLIRLADDRVLAVAGLEYRSPDEIPEKSILKILYELLRRMEQRIVRLQEVLDPAAKKWSPLKTLQKMPLYPRLHLLPDGDVFYSGVFNTHFLTPARYPSARWNPTTETWKETGGAHFKKNREEGISLLLALRPPEYTPEVLIAGGGTHNVGRTIVSLLHSLGRDSWSRFFAFLTRVEDSVEHIDLGRAQPRWELKGSMHHPRVHANGVLLPDGNLLVVGGMSSYGHGGGSRGDDHSVYEAELYDPAANTWTRMAAQQKARLYHSTALLLPDGRVLSMGSNPGRKQIERTIEVFSPPYLFRGERPGIVEAPGQIGQGQPFHISVDHAGDIRQVVLMRPGVVTHVTDTDQRLLELEFQVRNAETLEVAGPPTPVHMPHGWCLLFVLNKDGIPSIGKFIKMESHPSTPAI